MSRHRRGKIAGCCSQELEKAMINENLLEILRCPACVREKDGLLKVYQESWLVCQDCGRKYPIVEEIPGECSLKKERNG